jgi:hypothetical protein
MPFFGLFVLVRGSCRFCVICICRDSCRFVLFVSVGGSSRFCVICICRGSCRICVIVFIRGLMSHLCYLYL